MYKRRLNKLKPTLEAFINNLQHIYEVDEHAHLMEMTYEMFVKKCTQYNYLVARGCMYEQRIYPLIVFIVHPPFKLQKSVCMKHV